MNHPDQTFFKKAMRWMMLALWGIVGWGGCIRPLEPREGLSPSPGSRLSGELSIFFAASLDQVMDEMKTVFEQAYPEVSVRAEASGSQVAARKVSEYGREADLVLTADWRVLEDLLFPAYASWNLGFASNEIVLAYRESSRYGAEINRDNWPDLLLQDGVRVARVDENLAPMGYQTLLVWELAERYYAPLLGGRRLAQTLQQRASGNLLRAHVLEVVPLLGTEADYIFIYRSVAQGHHLPFVELPPEINLSDPHQAEFYAQVSTTYFNGTETVEVAGQPIVYGATIPREAPNPAAAEAFLELLLGATGQEILQGEGFHPLVPALCREREMVPSPLRGLVEESWTPLGGREKEMN